MEHTHKQIYLGRHTVDDMDTGFFCAWTSTKVFIYIKGYTHTFRDTNEHTHKVNSYGEAWLDTIQFLMSLLQMSSQAAAHEWLINQVHFTKTH